MKKILALLLAITLAFALVACGNEKDVTSEPDTSTTPTESESVDSTEATNSNTTSESSSDTETPSSSNSTSTEISSKITNSKPLLTHTHSYSKATCTEPKKCSCGATYGKALGHSYTNSSCLRCGKSNPDYSSSNYKTCIIEGCTDVVLENHNHCIAHVLSKCYGDDSCNQLRIENSYYCSTHKCQIDTCTYQKHKSGLCLSHYTLNKHLFCSVESCEKRSYENYTYCEEHLQQYKQYLCSYQDCGNSKSDTEEYCKSHKCSVNGCHNAKIGSKYCNYHTCGFQIGCYNQATYNRCCSTHKCARAGCQNVRTIYTRYCASHS